MMHARFLFASVLLIASTAFADGVTGTISRNVFQQLYLVAQDGVQYKVSSRATDVLKTLNRLENGDSVVATGRMDRVNFNVDIESIDFVGLRKIIGLWNTMNAKGMMQFKSYSDVNVYSYALQNSGGSSVVRSHKNFKYTVSPANNGDWVMFLSDDSSTQMGFLNIRDSEATISLLNSQTGDVSSVIRLRKIGN